MHWPLGRLAPLNSFVLLLDLLRDETAHWLLVQRLANLLFLPGVAVFTHVQRIMEEP